jgi:rhodanese-related sulfurtransferase
MQQILEFTNNHLVLTAALVGSLFVVIFTEFRLRARASTDLSVPDAIRMINDDGQVLDIRSPEAFGQGHITGARNIPADQLDASEAKLDAMKGRPIVVACENGMQCSRIAASLRAKGFENVYALKGGVTAWKSDNLPLVSGKKTGKSGKAAKSGKKG